MESLTSAPLVCLIEDDADIRAALRWLLEDAGYRVVETSAGPAGLALLHASAERLVVLLDHTLSELGGCDILDIVSHDATLRARHAFILLSTSPHRARKQCGETLEDLATPLVAMPFDIDALLAEVAHAVVGLR